MAGRRSELMLGFWVLAVAMVATAIWCVSAKKPVYSVVALLGHFAALAAMYLTLNAEFIAVDASHRVLRRDHDPVRVRHRAALSSGVAPFSAGPNRLPRIGAPAIVVLLIALGFLTYSLARVSIVTPQTSASGSQLGPVGERERLRFGCGLRRGALHDASAAVRSHGVRF